MRRLYWVFLDIQSRDQSPNHILGFVQAFLVPARFVGRNEEFEKHRGELNKVLAFSGLEYGSDGSSDNAGRRRRSLKQNDEQTRYKPSFRAGVSIHRC